MNATAEQYFRVEIREYSGLSKALPWLVTTVYTLLMRGSERNMGPARVCMIRLRDGVEVWHRSCYEAATVRATRERLEERLRSRTGAEISREYGLREDQGRLTTQRTLLYAGAGLVILVIAIVVGVHLFGSSGGNNNSPQYQAGYQAGQSAFQQEADLHSGTSADTTGDSYCQAASRGSSAFDSGCLQGWDDAQSVFNGGS